MRWSDNMGARHKIVGNFLYSSRVLRRRLKHHPPIDDCLPRPGRPAVVINDGQPLATPDVLDSRRFDFDVAVPIELDERDGRYYPPANGRALQSALSLHRRRLHIDVARAANNTSHAEDWIGRSVPLMEGRNPPRVTFDALSMIGMSEHEFDNHCDGNFYRRFPGLGVRRSYLKRKDIESHLEKCASIFYLLNDNIVYFKHIYSQFADIANKNFRGGNDEGKEVTLARLQQAVKCLPKVVLVDDLLDTAFYGLIDSSVIYLSHWVMSDLLDLTGALGYLLYGAFHPTIEQAQTWLYVVGCAPDTSPYRDHLRGHRRQLADRLVSGYGLLDITSELTEICCAVVCRRRRPEFSSRLQISFPI